MESYAATSLAALNTLLGTSLDETTDSRPPSGSAGGDLSGTYPNPTVSKLGGVDVLGTGAADTNLLLYSSANTRYEAGTGAADIFSLSDVAPANYTDKSSYMYRVNNGETAIDLVTWNDTLQVFPVFERDASDVSLVNGVTASGLSTTLSLRLSDDNYYTASSPVTVDADASGLGGVDSAEAAAAGLWHIYAVPTGVGTAFDLVFSQGLPTAAGPTSYAIWKYLWTVRFDGAAPVTIDRFAQAGQWYFNLDLEDDTYTLYSEFQTAAMTLNTWYPCDGVTAVGGTGTVPADIQSIVPTAWVTEIQLHAFNDSDGNSFMQFAAAGGDPPGWTRTDYRSNFLQLRATNDGGHRGTATANIPLKDEMLSFNWITATGDVDFSLNLRGYKNSLAGI
jgi:hypothetical protein